MKIQEAYFENFMLFDDIHFAFSPRINIISGESNTGKTILLKTLYSTLQAYGELPENSSKKMIDLHFSRKIQGVFRPDKNKIGRLVNRGQSGNKAQIQVSFDNT